MCGRDPSDEEIRDHLVFKNNINVFEWRYLLRDTLDDMVRRRSTDLVSPWVDGIYRFVDPELEGTVSIFNCVDKVKGTHIEVGLSLD